MRIRLVVLTALGVLLMMCNLGVQAETVMFLGAGYERDILFIAMSVPLFINTLTMASFGAVTTPTVLQFSSPADRKAAAWKLLIWFGLFSTALTAVLALANHSIAELLAPGFSASDLAHSGILLSVAVLNIPLQSTANVIAGYWIAREKVFVPPFALLLGSVFTIALIFIGRERASSLTVVISILVGNFVAMLSQLAPFVWEKHQQATRSAMPRLSPWAILRSSLPLSGATAVARGAPLIERNLASHFEIGTISMLGYANQLMAFLVSATTAPVAALSYAKMCEAWQANRKDRIINFLQRYGALTLGGALLVGGTVYLAIGPALLLVQPMVKLTVADAQAIGQYCRILIPAYVMLSMASFLTRPLYAASMFLTAALFDCLSFGVYAVAALVLARGYGGLGLAVAVVVYSGFHLPFIALVIHRRLGLRLGRKFLGSVGLLGLGAVCGILSCVALENRLALDSRSLANVLIGPAVYVVLFTPLMLYALSRQGLAWRRGI